MSATSEASQYFEHASVCSLSPNGRFCIGVEEGILRVRTVVFNEWRVGAVAFACQEQGNGSVRDFAWSPDGRLVAAQFENGNHIIYQGHPGRRYRPGQQRAAYCLDTTLPVAHPMAFDPKGKRLAIAGPTAVHLVETNASQTCFREISLPQAQCIAWSPDGRYLAVSKDTTILIYLVWTGRLLHTWSGGHQAKITALAWPPLRERLLSADAQGRVLLWDTRKEASEWEGKYATSSVPEPVEAVAWSPDGKHFAVLSQGNHVECFTRTTTS